MAGNGIKERMAIDILIEDTRWQSVGLDALADRAAQVTLTHLGMDPAQAEISLLACDDTRIAALNTDFRGKPQPTNVLSWPSQERGAATPGAAPAPPRDTELGDIALSYDTCLNEATQQGLAFPDHVSHLTVHGILHLLGYDHIRDLDATLMQALETAILGKLGIADPYRDEQAG
jgi:probable rRNA maturation factor